MVAGLVSDIARAAVFFTIWDVFSIAPQPAMGVLLAPLAVHHSCFEDAVQRSLPERGETNRGQTATPSAAPSATPSTPDLAAVEAQLTSEGYTIATHFAANGTTAKGYPIYDGAMTKDGINYSATIMQTDSSVNAGMQQAANIVQLESMGFSGSYDSNNNWTGTQMINGSPYGASVIVTDTNAVITMFAG
jgi:hypothetical protein